jgi:anti-sigma B factor antagonist
MNLITEHHDDLTIVRVGETRIDAAVAIKFKDAMRDITDTANGTIVLDLSQVDFIDSSGLGAIVAAMKQMGDAGSLDLAGLRPNVDKVFRLTRMDTVFSIHSSADAAIKANAC